MPEPVEEIIHNVTVVDPYRWLEERYSPKTEEWIRQQHTRSYSYFSESDKLDLVKTRVAAYLNVEAFDQPTQVGNRYFYTRQKKGQEQGCICVRDITTEEERVLLDPTKEGSFVAVRIHCISDDGSLLAYAIKNGGGDTLAIRVLEVETGNTFPDEIVDGYARGFTFIQDNSGYYYCQDTRAEIGACAPHEIKRHRFGTRNIEDRVVFRTVRTPRSRLVLMSDSVNLGASFVHDTGCDLEGNFYVASRLRDEEWRPVFIDRKPPMGTFLRAGRMYAMSFSQAPNGKFVELDEDGRETKVIIPERETRIRNLNALGNRIYATYLLNLKTEIDCWTFTGDYMHSIPTLEGGSFTLLHASCQESDALFCKHESFSHPPEILRYVSKSVGFAPWSKQESVFDVDSFSTSLVSYSSKDGTQIPMFLVSLNGTEATTPQPTILTSYGGFGVCMSPRFSVLVAIMLELGSVFALPLIRGGSDFGPRWHEAARGRNRQVAYDDFVAAAEWLCSNKITVPRKLAVFGGSNSGLLVAAAMTQRPDLFAAVLCIAPILDMVRYEKFDQARKWEREYGTVGNPEDFHALYAYSPYHRVREHVNYPSSLFVTGDKDDRCNPAHVRKMAARMQNRPAQLNPVLVDYSVQRGHSPVMPLSVRIDALARRISFLSRELNVEWHSEGEAL